MIDGMFGSIGDPGRKRHHLAGIPGDGRLHKAKPFTARQPSKGRPFVNAFRHAGRCPCLYFIRTRRKIPARDALRVGGFIEEAGMSDLQATIDAAAICRQSRQMKSRTGNRGALRRCHDRRSRGSSNLDVPASHSRPALSVAGAIVDAPPEKRPTSLTARGPCNKRQRPGYIPGADAPVATESATRNYFIGMSSTRRFFARPSSVSLSATGWDSP